MAQNVRSLAQAWVFRDRARPYALYEGEEPVGFMMFDWRPEKKWVEVWRLMIDHRFQGKGYGRAAVQKALEFCHMRHIEKRTAKELSFVSNLRF